MNLGQTSKQNVREKISSWTRTSQNYISFILFYFIYIFFYIRQYTFICFICFFLFFSPARKCACMNKNLPWSGCRAQKHIVCHSNTVFSLVRLIMWLLTTNENTILLWRRIYILALEPIHGRFLFIHVQKIARQTEFWRRIINITVCSIGQITYVVLCSGRT